MWFLLGNLREWSNPNVGKRGPSTINWEYSMPKVDDDKSLKNLTQRGACPFHTPQWSCYCDPNQWVVMVVIQSTIHWHLQTEMSIPLPNACNPLDTHAHYTLPGVFTHPQWTIQLIIMGETVGHNTISVIEALPLTESGPLGGWPSIGLGQWLHICATHLAEMPLLGDLCTPQGWEVKVDWESWPASKH